MDGRRFSVRGAIKCGLMCAWENIYVLLKAMLTSWAVVIALGIVTILANFPLMKNLAPLMIELQKCITPECTVMINTQMNQMITGTNALLFGSAFFLFSVVMMGIGLGFIRMVLNACDNNHPTVKDLFSCFDKRLISNFFASILFSILFLCGLILFFVPGILVLARFGFYMFSIVDKHSGPIESLKVSWNATRGNTLYLMGFMIIILIIAALLGLIPFSQLVVGPVMTFVMACAYRQLVPRS